MLASVFQLEMLLAGRRRRPYLLRWLYAAFLLALLTPLLFSSQSLTEWIDGGGCQAFFARFVVLHFGLLLLVTPVLTAGALTDEKTSGTLEHLLTAPLWPLEIVLGKFAARVAQATFLAGAGLPLIALLSGIGGDPLLPVALLIVSAALIVGLAGVSLLVSACCRTTRDALLTVYSGGVALVVLAAVGAWPRLSALVGRLNPVAALALDDPDQRWRHALPCITAWLTIGAIGTALAALCLRWAYLRQLRAVSRREHWWNARRPSVGGNPVLWRERWIEGIAPLPSLRSWPRRAAVAAVFLATAWSLVALVELRLPPGRSVWGPLLTGRWGELSGVLRAVAGIEDLFYWQGMAALALSSFVVVIRASASIAGEREKGTWQALLLTPLPTPNIVRGKHWGIIGAIVPYLIAYAVAAVSVSLFAGAAAAAWAMLWCVATLFAVQYAGAVGLWCSARAPNSWIALALALVCCYGAWIVFALPVTVLAAAVQGLLSVIAAAALALFEAEVAGSVVGAIQAPSPFAIAWGLALIAAFWLLTQRFLVAAERLIARRDRAREIDPQFHTFYKQWLEQIELKRRQPAPVAPVAFEEPLPLHEPA